MFTDVSHLVAPLPPGRYSGACVTDVDGDGRCEIVLANVEGPNPVLKWVGGQLRDVAPPALADADRPTTAVAAADVNADGQEEIYYATAPLPSDRLFAARTDGTWEDLFARPENRSVAPRGFVTSVTGWDRRGTGRYGFATAGPGQPIRLYEPSADGPLVDLAPALGLDRFRDSLKYLAAPLTGARGDLFGFGEDGSIVLLVPRTDGSYRNAADDYGLSDPGEWSTSAAIASVDGRIGLVIANHDGPQRLRVRQDDGSFRDVATPAFAFPSRTTKVVAADFNHDGAEEILFLNYGEPNRLFRTSTGLHLTDPGCLAACPNPVTTAAVADVDGDGRLELLLAFAEAPGIRLYRAVSSDHAWLRVMPLTRFGSPARGAVIRLMTGQGFQVRVVSGAGENEPVAHFGLGRSSDVDRVTITWPDGVTATLPSLAPRQLHRVPYPGG